MTDTKPTCPSCFEQNCKIQVPSESRHRLLFCKGLVSMLEDIHNGRYIHEKGNLQQILKSWIWLSEKQGTFPCDPRYLEIVARSKRLIYLGLNKFIVLPINESDKILH